MSHQHHQHAHGPGHAAPASHHTGSDHASPASHHTGSDQPSSSSETTFEKEFELERIILFTDAVFAIAITLLIIDIKWPEHEDQKSGRLLQLYAPTIFGFLAFATSFLYIARSWSVHLRLFRLVRKYDQGLVNRNLFFLFFIVVFPFANAGLTEHKAEAFVVPLVVYLANLGFIGIAHYRLCRYIVLEKPALSVEGRKDEKTFIYTRGRYTMYITAATPVIAMGIWLLFPKQPLYMGFSFVFLLVGMRITKQRLKALRPASST